MSVSNIESCFERKALKKDVKRDEEESRVKKVFTLEFDQGIEEEEEKKKETTKIGREDEPRRAVKSSGADDPAAMKVAPATSSDR